MSTMKNNRTTRSFRTGARCLWLLLVLGLWFGIATAAEAASLGLSPGTGVYTANSTFTVRVIVNTEGDAINAAEGTLSFNPRELSVVSINRSSSIFNLWVEEPSYSNSAGTISFSGGVPSGFDGRTGTVMSVTFRAGGSGTARVSFTNGSVLANDGRGTNILTAMNGGSYTIQAQSAEPEPEVIEYVAPANTPGAPVISSDTHADPDAWHDANSATLSWTLPAGITAVRTLLNENPTSVPTNVYEDPIRTITLDDLPEGESYFHLQFQNADGWGRVTHYRLAVDTENPESITIEQPAEQNPANPIQTLAVAVDEETSSIARYLVKVNDAEPFEVVAETASGTIELPPLDPGYHSVVVEAFDAAGNSIVGTYAFTIEAFDRPTFTEYPSEIREEVIPVIKGTTRPNAAVTVTLQRVGGEPTEYELTSDADGVFTFIPEGRFTTGVYELRARAVDEFGAQSEVSEPIRIAVQQPGYLRIGSLLISTLSVIIPLLVLVAALILGLWYFFAFFRRFRKRVRVESREALEILNREFADLQTMLRTQESMLRESRRTKKLTKAESEMIEEFDKALQASQQKVEKEIRDVNQLTRKKQEL